jgi:hypothetical protein
MINLRVTEGELEMIYRAASELYITPTDWMRGHLLRHALQETQR